MPNIPAQLDLAFRKAIYEAFGFEADPLIALSQNPKFGDYQANAAMGLARDINQRTGQRTQPRAVAELIKARLDLGEMAADVSIAGPGFINVRLSPAWVARQLGDIADDPRLSIASAEAARRTVVDYSGPNVAKQMHIGHLRPTNIGDALARILEFAGNDVLRQNHLGDWGTQFGMLLAYLKTSPQSPGSHIEDLNEFYRRARDRFDSDADFADESRQTVVRLQSGQAEECALWTRIVDESRRHFQPIYQRMNITLRPEHERGESFYNPMLADTVRELRDKGVAVESEGAIVVFVKGFEAPLIIQKRDGGFGYGTTDLAAIRYRARELGTQRIIYVTDARQIQHFAQVFDAARRAGWVEGVELDHVTFGTIFGVDGKPIKTREGDPPLLRNVLDEAEQRAFAIVTAKNPELAESQRRAVAHAVGIGAIKYFDLNKDRNSDYVFDWEQMLALEGNTAPYMQYAYARIRSIFRKAGVAESEVRGSVLLESPFELALARHLLRIEEVVELIARELRPHYLCNYLYELATKFSAFYENCPVLQSEQPTRSSRLALCDLTARTMALGLDLLGIEHPERM